MTPRPLPVADPTRCTASGRCVVVCPTDALVMRGPLPVLARPLACVACGACVRVCPANAITLAGPPAASQ